MLKKVEPKKIPAAGKNQRMGWTFNQRFKAEARFTGFSLWENELMVMDRKEPSNAGLVIAHSANHSSAIIPANKRNKATFGTSTFAIAASDMA